MTEVEPDDTAPKIEQDDGDTLTLGERQPLSDEALAIASRPLSNVKILISRATYVLKTAEDSLATATTTFTRLTNKEGFLTQAAHSASFGENGPAMQAALAEAMSSAEDVFRQSKMIHEAVGVEREPVLSDLDAVRANARMGMVREDIMEAPRLIEVQRNLQSALSSADSVSIYLAHRYSVKRLNEARPADNVDPARAACVALLEQMRGMIVDRRPAEIQQQAKELRQKALDFISQIRDRAASSQPRDARYSQF